MRIRLLLLFLLFFSALNAQDSLNPEWVIQKTPPVQRGEAWSVKAGTDGYLYWSTSQTWNDIYLDQVLYKLDENGNEIWTQPGIFRQTLTEQSYVVTEHNGIVYTGGRICDCVSLNLICCDFSIVAWNPATGDTLWSKRYDVHGEYEECDGLVVTDSAIYATGWTREANAEWFDIFLMKTDLNGDTLWTKTWSEGLQKDERQDGHIAVDDSCIYLTGLTEGIPSTIFSLSGLDGSASILKFDLNGNFKDIEKWGYNGGWIDFDDALGMTTDGTYLYAVGYVSPSGNNHQWFIRKYDKNLNMIWQDEWGGFSTEAGRSATVDDLGNIWCAVNSSSFGDSTDNILLLKYTPGGLQDGFYMWGDTGKQSAQDIIYYNGALYLSGRTNTNPAGEDNPLLIKVNLDSLAGMEKNTVYSGMGEITAWPQPSTGDLYISFELEYPAEVKMDIVDLSGKRVLDLGVVNGAAGNNEIKLQLDGLDNGMYFVRVGEGSRRHSRRIVISK